LSKPNTACSVIEEIVEGFVEGLNPVHGRQ